MKRSKSVPISIVELNVRPYQGTSAERAIYLRTVGTVIQSLDLHTLAGANSSVPNDPTPFRDAAQILMALEEWPRFDELGRALRAYYQSATVLHTALRNLTTDELSQLGIG
jgi:hypothetical protein